MNNEDVALIGITANEKGRMIRANVPLQFKLREISSAETIDCGEITFPVLRDGNLSQTVAIRHFDESFWRQEPSSRDELIGRIPNNPISNLRHSGVDTLLPESVPENEWNRALKAIEDAKKQVIKIDGLVFVRCGEPAWEVRENGTIINVQPGFITGTLASQSTYFQIENKTDAVEFAQSLAEQHNAVVKIKGQTDNYTTMLDGFSEFELAADRFAKSVERALPVILMNLQDPPVIDVVKRFTSARRYMPLTKIEDTEEICAVLDDFANRKDVAVLLQKVHALRQQCKYLTSSLTAYPSP